MALTECANGHLYDTDQYATCPYCGGNMNRVEFGAASVDSVGSTVAPSSYGGSAGGIGKTVGEGYPQAAPVAPVAAQSYDIGKTVGATVAPASYQAKKEEKSEDVGKTVAVMKRNMDTEPVVGWIVCVEGKNKGKDFRVLAKNNTIGRGDKMDICITGDNAISRENHARLAYDEKHNAYYLIPAESTNSIYVNEEPIYVPTIIKTGDLLELGESKFIFTAFCSDRFNWKDGLAKGEA
ncbi:MAG: FHA domain-containing protein [Clostridiales bacterium]|nr:FHA domain-containing protein [Clostridiales bacterium]